MAARNVMFHRCVIERDMAQGKDYWGQEHAPAWTDYLTNVSCRFWYDRSSRLTQAGTRVELVTKMLVLPVTTPLVIGDRIKFVTDRRGKMVASGPMRMDSLGARVDHLVATLVEVTPT